jgi:hypothetical protein
LIDLLTFYKGQDARIDFSCVDSAGMPLDLTSGRVEVSLQRDGINPFFIRVDSTNSTLVEWSNRAQGKGILIVPLAESNVPIGMIKMMVRSILDTGQSDVQYLGWGKVVRVPAPIV